MATIMESVRQDAEQLFFLMGQVMVAHVVMATIIELQLYNHFAIYGFLAKILDLFAKVFTMTSIQS